MADQLAADEGKVKSGIGAILSWAGGIASAVITAVLIYHFTQPAPPVTPPAPTIAPVALNGVVANSATHTLIGSANVTVTLGPNTVQQLTDPLGRYSVVLVPVGADANMGNVKIAAPGYVDYSNSVELQPGNNYAEIAINPVPPPSPTPGSPVAVQPVQLVPHAGIVLKKPPANYVKSSETAFAGLKKKE
jgi:hypothetical protein